MEIIKDAEIADDFPVYDQGGIAEKFFFGGHIFIKKRWLKIDSRMTLSSIEELCARATEKCKFFVTKMKAHKKCLFRWFTGK